MSTPGVVAPIRLARDDIQDVLQWQCFSEEGIARRVRAAAREVEAGRAVGDEERAVLVGMSDFTRRLVAASHRRHRRGKQETVAIWNVPRSEAIAAWVFLEPHFHSLVDLPWEENPPPRPPHFGALSRLLNELARALRGPGRRPMSTGKAWRWVRRYKDASSSWERSEIRTVYRSALRCLNEHLGIDEAQARALADDRLDYEDDEPDEW